MSSREMKLFISSGIVFLSCLTAWYIYPRFGVALHLYALYITIGLGVLLYLFSILKDFWQGLINDKMRYAVNKTRFVMGSIPIPQSSYFIQVLPKNTSSGAISEIFDHCIFLVSYEYKYFRLEIISIDDQTEATAQYVRITDKVKKQIFNCYNKVESMISLYKLFCGNEILSNVLVWSLEISGAVAVFAAFGTYVGAAVGIY